MSYHWPNSLIVKELEPNFRLKSRTVRLFCPYSAKPLLKYFPRSAIPLCKILHKIDKGVYAPLWKGVVYRGAHPAE